MTTLATMQQFKTSIKRNSVITTHMKAN